MPSTPHMTYAGELLRPSVCLRFFVYACVPAQPQGGPDHTSSAGCERILPPLCVCVDPLVVAAVMLCLKSLFARGAGR